MFSQERAAGGRRWDGRQSQRGTVRGTSHREGEKIRSLRDGDQQVGTMTHAETELKVQRLRLGNPTH